MSQRYYSDEEAELILRTAAKEASTGGLSRDRLLATAAELGITPEAVDAAEKKVSEEKEDAQYRAEYRAKREREFRSEWCTYLGTNALLLTINFFTSGRSLEFGRYWSLWVIVIWGLMRLSDTLTKAFKGRDEKERDYQKWLIRQHRRKTLAAKVPAENDELLESLVSEYGEEEKLKIIKEYRDRTGANLTEAKDAVDLHLELRSDA